MSDFTGKPCPPFNLEDEGGNSHSLEGYSGQWFLLYFYPKDMTPGCTIQAKTFRDLKKEYEEAGITVLGVSADDQASHQKFYQKHDLNFPLLVDEDAELSKALGIWVLKKMMGKEFMGIQRDSFLVGPDGEIKKHYVKVNPAGHPGEVLEDFKAIT